MHGMHPGMAAFLDIQVRRGHEMEDALNQIVHRPTELKKPLRVAFAGEQAAFLLLLLLDKESKINATSWLSSHPHPATVPGCCQAICSRQTPSCVCEPLLRLLFCSTGVWHYLHCALQATLPQQFSSLQIPIGKHQVELNLTCISWRQESSLT